MNTLLSTFARAITMVISVFCGILSARLVLAQAGVEYFALLSLIGALPGLVSFSDLGAGAVVINSVATSTDIRKDTLLHRQVTTVGRVILMFAGAIAISNAVLFLTGGWRLILGSTAGVSNSELALFVCVNIFCLTIPLGLWQRILIGMGRNPVVILLQGIISPLSLLLIWILLSTGLDSLKSFLALGSFVATFIVAVVGTVIVEVTNAPLLSQAAREVLHPRRFPPARVMDVGWPMFAQLLAAPLSLGLPRYILAQTATPHALAQYALAGQVFAALQALVVAGGVTLWPAFSKARAQGTLSRGPFLISAVFGVAIASTSLIILAVSPWLFNLISAGKVEVESTTVLAFGLMITLQAVLYPLGMFIMDKRGIRFQVAPALLMALSSILLTFVLVPPLGIVGPLLANAFSVAVFQLMPFAIYIRVNRARLYGKPAPTPDITRVGNGT
jgi:O-antigen/teichoic acid export membrane protein